MVLYLGLGSLPKSSFRQLPAQIPLTISIGRYTMNIPTKICGDCKQEFPLTNFHKDKSSKDGLYRYCRQCNSKRSSQRDIEKSRSEGDEYEEYRAKKNAYRKAWRERNKREKQPCVYLIYAENGVYKIGRTNDVESRFEVIKNISPVPVTLILTIDAENSRKLEMELHDKFSEKRYYNEWFSLDESDIEYIRSLSEDK